jgi:HlyD family secretion protein
MEVRIEPATVKKEEFGTLIGKVLEVSDFPMTAEGMLSVLQNARLVDQFMAEGPPYAVRVMLVGDSAAGYRWSGGKAPPVRLSSGTTARAAITVARQAPASFLIPMLRGQAGFSS